MSAGLGRRARNLQEMAINFATQGTEVDLHTPHWHGNTVVANGMRMDTVSLLPAGVIVADMVPDDAGVWLFHCHVNEHLVGGMVTRYRVVP